ncbi:MAG: hypothetical protein A2622_01595 [Bdellovibrionales bacterium RIFCSPHIGHO2_01_FULL_40_29]|nr:MAG: hypothetical protein A2622_01595 [Bdellovibrionales bacterium RIFCSPHIGHO2_01_FULL_40_29]OFZ33789.1 MAG: hypothetical protein A3D17_02015 [Bdellovibrionales bacterium RIFCSPHIGHO2_02_FULL_40_15]
MQQLTKRAVTAIVEAICKVNIITSDELLANIPRQCRSIVLQEHDMQWSDFVDFLEWCDRTYAMDWLKVGEECHESSSLPIVKRLLGSSHSVKMAYWIAAKWLGESSFPLIKTKNFQAKGLEVIEELELATHHRYSIQIFQIFQGMLAAMPEKVFGLKPAHVEMNPTPRGVVYNIVIPQEQSVLLWLWRRIVGVFYMNSLLRELTIQQEEISEKSLALLKRQGEFQNLIENFQDGVFIHCFGEIRYANPKIVEFLGYEHNLELVGHSIFEKIIPPENVEMVQVRMMHLMSSSEQNISNPPVEIQFITKSGGKFNSEATAVPITFQGQRCVAVTVRDLSDRKKLQAHLMTTDRMTALGQLAAGVGHEINNPLTYVMMNLEMLTNMMTSDHITGYEKQLAAIQKGLERIRSVVKDLKKVSRYSEEESLTNVDVNTVLDSVLSMAKNEIQQRALCNFERGDVPPIWIDETRLAQVLLNLLVNAAQAIEPGDIENNSIEIKTSINENQQVCIEISDTGAGMSPEVQKRVFEPFFTTKPIGTGTGLGLPICQNIVNQFKGHMEFESKVGEGTKFRVLFPISAHLELPQTTESVDVESRKMQQGQILLIDDDSDLLAVLQEVISTKHDCVGFTDARMALDTLHNNDSFDGIICDLMMPTMSGMQFYSMLKEVAPQYLSKIVFMTGGSFTSETDEFLSQPNIRYCEKPVDTKILMDIIQSMIQPPKLESTSLESTDIKVTAKKAA